MPVNLLVQEGYTPKAGYDKPEKELLDVAVSQNLQESQPDEEGGEVNPHVLSRQQNDDIIESVFGPPRKGRRRFKGSGSFASSATSSEPTTSFEPTRSSMPSTVQPPDDSQVLNLRSRVIAMLTGRLDPTVFAQIMTLIFGDIGTPRFSNVISHIVLSLHGKIPDDIYVDVITRITATQDPNAGCAQPREGVGSDAGSGAGSTSVRRVDDAVDLGDHDGGEE